MNYSLLALQQTPFDEQLMAPMQWRELSEYEPASHTFSPRASARDHAIRPAVAIKK